MEIILLMGILKQKKNKVVLEQERKEKMKAKMISTS